MKRFLLPGTVALLAAVTLLVALAGCGKKVVTPDANYTTLEGKYNPNARIVVWPDSPDTVHIWTDLGSPGPAAEGTPETDFISDSLFYYRSTSGVMHVMIFDGTTASAFQVFRKSASGGFERLQDFVINPSRKWLNSEWEVYETVDKYPSGYSPATYIGRGIVAGTASQNAPLTNEGMWSAPMPRATIAYKDSVNPAPYDSLFRMRWTGVPGAAGYWIHVYQFKASATPEEIRASGTPAPIWNGNVRDYFVGYIHAPATQFSLRAGSQWNAGVVAEVFKMTPPIHGQEYLVRITAVDDAGRVVGYMHGSEEISMGDGFYQTAPLAAQRVTPRKPK